MTKKKEKIVITGTSGFLGSRLLQKFNPDYKVYGPDRKQMNLTDRNECFHYLREVRPEYLIHCAATSDIGQCEKNPEVSYEINVNATKQLVEIGSEMGTKMIFCSSDQVYLNNGVETPHLETEDVQPPHHYGKQKREAELQLLRYAPDTVCLRLSWMYDIRKRNALEHGNLYANIIQAISHGERMQYPVFDKRSITNVWEVVDQMHKVLQLAGGIYNFGSANAYSTYELVEKMLLFMGADTDLLSRDETSFSAAPRNLLMDCKKVQNHGIKFYETLDGFKKVADHMK